MGRDSSSSPSSKALSTFQSTLPAWGETRRHAAGGAALLISIHSPRMGRDTSPSPFCLLGSQFQSTLPAWGETICLDIWPGTACRFQSTLPAWGETGSVSPRWGCGTISIHSPRMGRDRRRQPPSTSGFYFNPLSPHGERRKGLPVVLTHD